MAQVGLASVDERDTVCCYAKQDKFWVEGAPNGERWEVYTVLADSEEFGDHAGENEMTEPTRVRLLLRWNCAGRRARRRTVRWRR